ncbi:hypothetical protein ACMU_04240 [Actibacterium mucosum KCTC 23349]|uniref:YjiS-like domain-containing protein n=1 Tax=Actibacterium mucosum KCTC 23349 TaxID=1454373 RepID=A0A037ZES1_9RHOB|nr:DUF1127 domain-containing protein [Actibacterium mucosum]KAJ54113.1 hypothetical protein ACMU_04240 [Actibacterium mucosum KCTC 23349]
MAAFETTRPLVADRPTFGFIGALAALVLEWNDRRVTRKSLSKLSDDMLEDIGLTRADVNRL